LRIIGGTLKGRTLRAKPGPSTRPTSDRAREAVASALEARDLIRERVVLDLFAGTGALGLEALSRGAVSALLVDSDRHAIETVAQNVQDLGLAARARTLQLDLLGAPDKVSAALRRTGRGAFGLAFVDPPYAVTPAAVELLADLACLDVLGPGAAVVLEHGKRAKFDRPACFRELAIYRYGDSQVALWETIAPADDT
jgi:16S rRNA (guanine966-N2)-methyltransferase